MQDVTHHREGFTISTDQTRLDLDMIHSYLSREAFWSLGIPLEVLIRAIRRSLCFGIYEQERQIGFARVVTDGATFAYLCDVFVLPNYRGRGLSKWLMELVLGHPELQGLRRFVLATRDAHGLYAQFGFETPAEPKAYMHIHKPNAYQFSKDAI
jgi:GNAT superfamily N-acetyltransferase